MLILSNIAIDEHGNTAQASNKLERKNYKCLNPNCNAVLRIRKGEFPCFFAIESHPHISGCNYANNHEGVTINIPPNFSIDNFVNQLAQKASSGPSQNIFNQKKTPHTVSQNVFLHTPKQLYDICKKDSEAYCKYCVDKELDAIQLMKYGLYGLSGARVISGTITGYFNKQNYPVTYLIVTIQNKNNPQRFARFKIEMNYDCYDTLQKKLLARAGRVLEANIIVCAKFHIANDSDDIDTTYKNHKTATSTWIKSPSQIYVFYMNH